MDNIPSTLWSYQQQQELKHTLDCSMLVYFSFILKPKECIGELKLNTLKVNQITGLSISEIRPSFMPRTITFLGCINILHVVRFDKQYIIKIVWKDTYREKVRSVFTHLCFFKFLLLIFYFISFIMFIFLFIIVPASKFWFYSTQIPRIRFMCVFFF